MQRHKSKSVTQSRLGKKKKYDYLLSKLNVRKICSFFLDKYMLILILGNWIAGKKVRCVCRIPFKGHLEANKCHCDINNKMWWLSYQDKPKRIWAWQKKAFQEHFFYQKLSKTKGSQRLKQKTVVMTVLVIFNNLIWSEWIGQ